MIFGSSSSYFRFLIACIPTHRLPAPSNRTHTNPLKKSVMSSRPSSIVKPAVVLPKRTPVLIQPDSSDQLFTNRVVGVVTIVLYTSAVFVAGYLTGKHRTTHTRFTFFP